MSFASRVLQCCMAFWLAVGGLGVGLPRAEAVGALTVPTGFADTLVANPGGQVTAFAWAPDGRMLITTQGGTLRVVQNGTLLATAALNFTTGWPQRRICTDFERGLLGVAVDPDFTANNYIYLYYTAVVTPTVVTDCGSGAGRNSYNVVNRVSRFTLSGNTVTTTTEQILIDNIPSLNGNHNAGDLNFGRDGLLYVTAGDSGTGGGLARSTANLAGKVLRINADGTPPASNPFYNAAGARRCGLPGPGNHVGNTPCREIYAYGLRNPFRFAFDPNAAGTRFFINDVGQNQWEEIDEGVAGADYGWNVREGPCPNGQNCTPSLPSAYTDPLHWYNHSVGPVITGGAFVPDGIGWPAAYVGAYLFADGVAGGGSIFRITPVGAGPYARTTFASSLGYVVHLRFGPYNGVETLYYSVGGQVRRIAYTSAGVPTAGVTADPTSGAAPLAVTFDGSSSTDPESGALTYHWDFGNTLTQTTTTPTTVHTYTVSGVYTATLVVQDPQDNLSLPAAVQIQVGNSPPTPVITAPGPGGTFTVGQTVSLAGSATDAQGDPYTLSWEVRLWHVSDTNPGNAHYHPFHSATGAASAFTAPAPEDLNATALSYVEVRLTATDSLGLSATVTRTVEPQRVTMTFATTPAGLQLQVNERTLTDGQQVTSWTNATLNLSAPAQAAAGQWWVLAPFTVTVPAANATVPATFVPARILFLPYIR